ncbi:MAG: Ig-like domain-containing protein [Clostridiales bacterium]|nr:Ig-like domain-containing protein [Clostridiales bacterium]MDU3243488.1 Ig-like domain-containing protein [Clostridiales bacterium]
MRKKKVIQKFFIWMIVMLLLITDIPVMVVRANETGSGQQEEIMLKTTLQNGFTQRASKKTFDVWARDSEDNKVDSEAFLYSNDTPEDLEALAVSWNDDKKTSYLLNMTGKADGSYGIIVRGYKEDGSEKEVQFHFTYKAANKGECVGYAALDIELFTISKDYLIEPVLVPVYEGENSVRALQRLIHKYGFEMVYTGSLDTGFYLAKIKNLPIGFLKDAVLEPKVATVDEVRNAFDPAAYIEGELGEFNFSRMSGWMYCLNNVFPNVGFADTYLSDGDVVRVQFTVGYGSEIGGSGAMGGGDIDDYYLVADKDRLTYLLASINSAANREALLNDPKINLMVNQANQVMSDIGAEQNVVGEISEMLENTLIGEVTAIKMLTEDKEIMIHDSEELQVAVEPEQTHFPVNLHWTSSDPEVVSVESGEVTAVSPGVAQITASYRDLQASCTITVPESPMTGIELSADHLDIRKNQKSALEVIYLPSNTSDNREVQWSSSNVNAATVDEKGMVVGRAAGDTVITAVCNDFDASCTVSVKEIPMTDMSLSKESMELTKGATMTLKANSIPEDATDDITWTYVTSDPEIAAVGKTGIVKGIAEGEADITVSSGAFSKTCKVTVKEIPLQQISISPPCFSLSSVSGVKIKNLLLTVSPDNYTEKIRWKSSDSSVASVNENGLVMAKKNGTVWITAYGDKSGLSASTMVKVIDKAVSVNSLSFSQSEISLEEGKTLTLPIKTSPANATDPFKWVSDQERIVTVKDGTITAKSLGTANVTVYSGDQTASCKITVQKKSEPKPTPPPTPTPPVPQPPKPAPQPKAYVKLNVSSIPLQVKKSTKVVKVKSIGKGDKVASWTSSNKKVATVTKSGKITAKKKGTAKITVKTKRGAKAVCRVKVQKSKVVTKSLKV